MPVVSMTTRLSTSNRSVGSSSFTGSSSKYSIERAVLLNAAGIGMANWTLRQAQEEGGS